jgi:excisionase family DNA binding protein
MPAMTTATITAAGSPWLTRLEAAAYLKIHTDTLDALVRAGRLTRYTNGKGRIIRYRRDELDATLAPETSPVS